jgi:hypothetical protein
MIGTLKDVGVEELERNSTVEIDLHGTYHYAHPARAQNPFHSILPRDQVTLVYGAINFGPTSL